MNKRPSKRYLVIGNVHLGTDKDVLSALSVLAEEYDAQVIHTGNISTYVEKQMHDRRVHRLRTFETIEIKKHEDKTLELHAEIEEVQDKILNSNSLERSEAKLKKQIKEINDQLLKLSKKRARAKDEYSHSDKVKVHAKKGKLKELNEELRKVTADKNANVKLLERRDALFNKLDTLAELTETQRKRMIEEVQILREAQEDRIMELKKHFPNIKFIANDEQYIYEHELIVGETFTISKYLDVQSVNANGDKTSSEPITDRAFRYLKSQKKSVIVPHPSPCLKSYEKEGLNNAWNMYTTGALFSAPDPKRPSEFYKSTYLPSALLVVVDVENGEFHASRMHFDLLSCDFAHRVKPAILHDGRVFTGGGMVEVAGADAAVYSTDDHAPFEHLGVLASTRALLKLSKAETFINGGDAGDWTSLCPHNKGKPRASEGLRFKDDKEAVKRMMTAQGDSPYLRHKVLIDSNHENWIERYVDENPAMEGTIDQRTLYKEIIPEWECHIPVNGEDYTYYFGDLAIRHGHNEQFAKATKLFNKYLGGHFHSHNEILRCGSSGAGARLGPKYLQGNLTKWQNCVTTITRYKGKTSFDIKSVLHDKKSDFSRFAYQGNIYEVPVHIY